MCTLRRCKERPMQSYISERAMTIRHQDFQYSPWPFVVLLAGFAAESEQS